MIKRPEILAPCGNMSSLNAAIKAGTDACYLAGNSFGARAYADNFTESELIEAIDTAHLHGVKVYLTCNTLIKNNELLNVYKMLRPLYNAGLDAVLVQDYGVMRMLREYFPGLPIHTSTQMNILTTEGALLAKERGASRVVAAREMSIEELARVRREADIEVEAFVHGAMCLCYSGRCLMSSMAGGRSGNRGRCAQPCRQRYNGKYLLSMRDLCTLKYIPELVDAGIDSLKIEGRMKNEYYTASVVEAYKVLVDEYINGTFTDEKADQYEKRLLEVFNRGGFSTGYMMRSRDEEVWDEALIDSSMPGRRGVKVGDVSKISGGQITFKALKNVGIGDELLIDTTEPISITSNKECRVGDVITLNAPETRKISRGTSIYRTRSKTVTTEIEELLNTDKKLSITGTVKAIVGESLSITLKLGDVSVSVSGGVISEASNRPIDEETIRTKVSQLGNTEFTMNDLEVELDGKGFVRIGELSELRRTAVEKLKEEISGSFRKNDISDTEFDSGLEKLGTLLEVENESKHLGNNYYYSFSYPYQVEAFLSNIPKEIDGISGHLFVILDLGLGGFSKEDLIRLRDKVRECTSKNTEIILGLPYINRGEYDIQSDYGDFIESIDGLYIRNIDDFATVRNLYTEKFFLLASSLYAYNNLAVEELKSILQGHSENMILFDTSLELSIREINKMNYRGQCFSLYYGKLPLMITSGLRDTIGILKDDRGYNFKSIYGEGLCYNVILNDRPISLHEYQVQKFYSFTDETEAQVRDALSDEPKFIREKKFTRGHIEKGI